MIKEHVMKQLKNVHVIKDIKEINVKHVQMVEDNQHVHLTNVKDSVQKVTNIINT